MGPAARLLLVGAAAAALLGLSPFEEAADPADIARLRGYRVVRFSSADPTGGNLDHDNFLRWEGDLAVLAEADGPGAVVRLWATSPTARGGVTFPGTALVFFDGASTPDLELPLTELLGGRAPFVPPLAGPWAGGWTSFVPIPFAGAVKLAVRGVEAGFYYQVDVARYPDGTSLDTFALPLAPGDADALARQAAAWSAPPGPLPGLGPTTASTGTATLAPGAGADLVTLAGGGVIAEVDLQLDAAEAHSLPALRLRFSWDGAAAPQVDALLADLFAADVDPATGAVVAHDGLALSVQGGRFRCFLPMPFAAGARLRLENEADRAIAVTLTARIAAGCPGADFGRLHAIAAAGTPPRGDEFAVAVAAGRGQLAGLAVRVRDCVNGECLEGDEHVTLDDAHVDGTGLEDYVGGGWYFDGGAQPKTTATAGEPYLDLTGRLTAFRFHFADPWPFQDAMAATLEHGGMLAPDTTPASYRTVAFLYLAGRSDCADADGGVAADGGEPTDIAPADGAARPEGPGGCACRIGARRGAARGAGGPGAGALALVAALAGAAGRRRRR